MLISFPASPPKRPVYDELIKPHERQILFYDFRRKVPDVAPLKRVGRAPTPRGAELSKQAIIATSKKPKSKQVFISVPVPKIEIHEDLPAPLLVARLDATLPPPPAPPAPRKFVPPRPLKKEPRLPIQTPVLEAPPSSAPASAAISPPLPAPTLTFSVAVPVRSAPEALTAHSGNAKADIAVASLHPSPNADSPVPNGERPARFSKAPTEGAAASGAANPTDSLTVPDLTIRQPKPETTLPAPHLATPTQAILYAERVRIPLSTLSVPLRPANRMIPPAVDARFQGRNVYTIVIPMEHMPSYAGDWIMWFADRQSKPGETPVIRAPVPFRKLEPIDQPAPSSRIGERIQFAATLNKKGRLDGITLITRTTPAAQRAVFEDVTSWEFQPATRDGVPVDVDVFLEIPFRLP